MSFLEVSHVSVGFGPMGRRTEVLHDLNLSINRGEFVAIIGYSGSGKSTLMALLAGLLPADTGTITLGGRTPTGPGPDRGLVFQNYSLLPWLTVFENVKLAVDQVFADWTESKRREHTEKYVALVNLTAARDKRPTELSGGMRQRVSVARTLAMQPEILLCDEPLSALDALTRANLQDELARLSTDEAQTVVLVTNDPDEAILLADRVIPLTQGPRATLGPSIPVLLPRPRDRKVLQDHSEFKRLRQQIVGFLLTAGARPKATVTRTLTLPAIEPEDLSRPGVFGTQRAPVRKNELREMVVVVRDET
ncbi:MAG TPA: ABC transporter ATP-binding protein [Verrucomicrobiota bacterium]|nr:ABC transporter ATP-binding protein [Verrucomicrobiota bacterium]